MKSFAKYQTKPRRGFRLRPTALGPVESLETRQLLSTYYVDSVGGSDKNNGTTAPWQSLAKVNSMVFKPGDEILFKAGDTWTGQLNPHGAGTSSNWITIDQYGTGAKPLFLGTAKQATLYYSSDQWNGMTDYWNIRDLAFSGGGAAVEILDGSTTAMHGVQLEGLQISNIGTLGLTNQGNGAIWLMGWAGPIDDVSITDNTITDVGSDGIWVQGANNGTSPLSTNVVVSGNDINGTGMDGIEVDYAVSPMISYNTIYGAGAYDHPGGNGNLYFVGLFPLMCNGGTIEYNEIAYTATSPGGDSQALDLDNGNSGTFYFQYNYSHDNAGGFMETTTNSLLHAGDLCVVRYNISQNDGDAMGAQQGCGLFRITGQHLLVYNNTFYNASSPNVVQKWWWNGAYVASDASFYNNIFDSPYGFISEINTQGAGSNPFTYDHNIFVGGSVPADATNSIVADPQFLSPGSGGDGFTSLGGYHLMAGSPAVASGIAMSNNGGIDFLANPIVAGAPTMGAIQVVAPTVASPASATMSSTGNTATLSVLGSDDSGESTLSYTWATIAVPTAGIPMPIFSANGTNAAKNSTVTFSQAGVYQFAVTITDQLGLSVTSTVTVTVNQLLTSIKLTPSITSIMANTTERFTASGYDQFGQPLISSPTYTWAASGGGTIDSTGLYTAPVATSAVTITASSGSISVLATLSVIGNTPAVMNPASAVMSSTGKTAILSVLGGETSGESKLTYTWATTAVPTSGVPTPTFSANGTNAAKNSTVTFYRLGSYTFTVTIRDASGASTTSLVNVVVGQVLTRIAVTTTSGVVSLGLTQQLAATGYDQYNGVLATQPAFTWSVAGGGSVSSTGFYTAGLSAATPVVTATSGSVLGQTTLTVLDATPTVATSASATLGAGRTALLSVLGADGAGESKLTYTWVTTTVPTPGIPMPTFSANATNSAKNSTVTFYRPGTYVFTVTIKYATGLLTTSNITVLVS